MSQTATRTADAFAILDNQQFMSLTTFRKTGQGVATPVWFVRVGDVLYVTTMREAGKAKRISHTPRVTVAPCKANGQLLGSNMAEGAARILDATESSAAQTALQHKYGYQRSMFNLMGRIRGNLTNRIYLEIKPAS